MRAVAAATTLVLVALAAACGDGGPASASPRPLPGPTGEVRTEPVEPDQLRVWPRSARVEPEVAYRMTAYTHCGLDHSLDFDGSFWEVEAAPDEPWAALDDPEDEGVITLVSDDTAVYVSASGDEFRLRRLEGPLVMFLCE